MPGSSPPGPRLLRVAWHSAGAEWADSVPRTEHESVPDTGQGVTHAGKGDTSCPQEAQSPSCGFDVCHWGACRKGSPRGSAGGGGQASALNSPAGGSGGAGDPTGVIAGPVPSAKESRRIQRKSLSRARLQARTHRHRGCRALPTFTSSLLHREGTNTLQRNRKQNRPNTNAGPGPGGRGPEPLDQFPNPVRLASALGLAHAPAGWACRPERAQQAAGWPWRPLRERGPWGKVGLALRKRVCPPALPATLGPRLLAAEVTRAVTQPVRLPPGPAAATSSVSVP